MNDENEILSRVDFSRYLLEIPELVRVKPPSENTADALYEALRSEVERLKQIVPEDHDILVIYRDLVVLRVTLLDQVFVLQGADNAGNHCSAICYYGAVSLCIRAIRKPGDGDTRQRVCTGFDRAGGE